MKKIVIYLLLLIGQAAYGQNIPTGSTRPSATAVTVPSAYNNNININFVRTWEPEGPTTDTSWVNASARSTGEVKMNTEYMDGLGRTIQVVKRRMSPAGYDLVSPVIYDAYGREQYKYLPYVSNTTDGKFKADPFNSQQTFYRSVMPGESIYYGQTTYEPSPLNRILKSYAAGNSWAAGGGNKPVENQYLINNANDSVRIWSMSGSVPVTSSVYAPGTLQENVSIDEAGNKVVAYKDKDDRVVLKKVQLSTSPSAGHTGWLCTYYVYDDLGNLRAVIPPLAVQPGWDVSGVLNELCYRYQYDECKRMIEKRVPGAGPVYLVYDVRDRLVFSQDSMQRAASPQEWLVNFYDNLDRPVMTAIYKANTTRAALQTSMNTATANTQTITNTFPLTADLVLNEYDGSSAYTAGHSILFTPGFNSSTSVFTAEINTSGSSGSVSVTTSNPLPSISASALTPLTYTFYDNYTFIGKQSYLTSDITKPEAGSNPNAESLPASPSSKTKGLVTGKRIRVLGTDQWLTSTIYYNDKGRVVQTLSDNHTGGRDVVTTLYDFSGKTLSTYLRHKNPRSGITPQTTVLTIFNYDDAGRLLNTIKRLNDNTTQDRTIAANTYDELGQLQRKRLHVNGSNQLDTLYFQYNIRSWLTGINKAYVNSSASNNWFGEDLAYDYGFSTNQYNGNIAGVKWKTPSDGTTRSYGYSYDRLSRLTQADYAQQNTTGANWTADKMNFSVSNLTYDANGNIGSMRQQGMIGTTISLVDRLKYTYQSGSNKLLAVKDTAQTSSAKLGDFNDGPNLVGNDYAYNGNGNLTLDSNKAISSISYNHLNLPVTISVTGKGTVSFLYDAGGTKLRKTVVDNSVSPARTTVTDYVGGFVYQQDTLQFVSQEEGRIRPMYITGRPLSFTYDYFEKDHLGNVRVVLGTKSDTSVYAATMETAAASVENALFSNIDNTRQPRLAGYPADNTTSPNDYVAKLNGVNGQKIGPSLVLRVMAGDSITIVSRAFYRNAGASTSGNNSTSMVNAILQAFSGSGGSDGVHGGTGINSPISMLSAGIYDALKTRDSNQNVTTQPKAYLNFAAFDDQFNLVDENSGVRQVKGEIDSLISLVVGKMAIKKTGFIYIYESNESGQDVFFDNLIVTHNSGPLLEETHYYPFGLTMAGVSSKALKGMLYPENKRKYNGIELDEEFDINEYEAFYRTLDPQTGRWGQVDPKVNEMEAWSPYVSNFDNPIRNNDFLGDEPDGPGPKSDNENFKAATESASTLVSESSKTFWTSVGSGALGAVDAFVSDNLMGGGNIDVEGTGLSGENATGYQVGQKVGHAAATIWGAIEEGGAGLSAVLSGGAATPVSVAVSAHGVSNIARGLSGITEPIRTVHGNNKGSQKVQHGYGLWDRQEGGWNKYGISGQKLNQNGSSPRANKQANAKNAKEGWDRWVARVIKPAMRNRQKALDWENGKVKSFRMSGRNSNGDKPTGNKRPDGK